ncbi:MAG TPA: DUF6458 family protein [Acidimicrobiia bacterium]|nr:DUF6458 family protein [Acidimicrobiia bacterium]
MGIGVSIFLLAVGAILTFAVEVNTEGANLDTIGIILMVIGGIGLLAALVLMDSGPWRRRGVVEDVAARDDVVVRRRV